MKRSQRNKDKYLLIGELAKIVDVSNQTLIYYDKIGLLEPSWIDPDNGYRYYSRNKIFFLTSVKYLKDAGFTLKEIQNFLTKQSVRDITKIYNTKLNQTEKEIEKLIQFKKKLNGYINFFENLLEPKRDYDPLKIGKIEIKKILKKQVISLRKKIVFDYPSLMFLYNQLLSIVFKNSIPVKEQIISIFHCGYTDIYHKKCDIELAMETSYDIKNRQIKTIPEYECIACIHKGKYPSSIETYKEMKNLADRKNYQINGPVLHFLLVPIAACENPDDTLFEIHLPLLKA